MKQIHNIIMDPISRQEPSNPPKLTLASDKHQIFLRISEFSSIIISGKNQGHLDSYILKICQLSWGSIFWQQNGIFDQINGYSYFLRWNWLTFEPVDRYSNLKNINW